MNVTDTGETRHLTTYIPEQRRCVGLDYGAHVSLVGGSGYYVRLPGGPTWYVARQAPLYDYTDAEIVATIEAEIDADAA